jgi:hypothetical protein
MNRESKVVSPVIFSIAYKDLVDMWIETIHPNDHVLIVWDARNHLEVLARSGFNLKEEVIYNNKILTVIFDSLMDCFRTMDIIDSHEDHPYVQIYSEGELLTDNLENLREDITS